MPFRTVTGMMTDMNPDTLRRLKKLAGDRGGVTRTELETALGLSRRQLDRRLAGLEPVGTWREEAMGRPRNLYAPEAIVQAIITRMWLKA